MSEGKYILDDRGNPIPEPDLRKWSVWFENNDSVRQVAKETVNGCDVSTVFLGLDHNYGEQGPPILWETMVFGGPLHHEQDRCSGSREQAEAMHSRMVERARAL